MQNNHTNKERKKAPRQECAEGQRQNKDVMHDDDTSRYKMNATHHQMMMMTMMMMQ